MAYFSNLFSNSLDITNKIRHEIIRRPANNRVFFHAISVVFLLAERYRCANLAPFHDLCLVPCALSLMSREKLL
jgi:hypothetical protein